MNKEFLATNIAPCRIHGKQEFLPMSDDLALKIKMNERISQDDLVYVEITSEHGVNRYIVSGQILREHHLESAGRIVLLRNRDKKNKSLNDRLLIQKLMKKIKWICPKCAEGLIS